MELSELGLDKILLFFFSSIGVLNTFFLAMYFSLFVKHRSVYHYLLAGLLIVIGLREVKSVLVLFYGNHLSHLGFFGQSADVLIGPLLYLFVKAYTSRKPISGRQLLIHVFLYLLLMMGVFGLIFLAKQQYTSYTKEIGGIIYIQWITYILLSAKIIQQEIRKLFTGQPLEKKEWWLLTIVGAVAIIWLAYVLTHYGNYVLGGVSISAVLYLSLILWLHGRKSEFHETAPKYANKKIADDEVKQLDTKLRKLMAEQTPYFNPELKLGDVATELNVSPHQLSQVLNDNLKTNFNQFVNQFRVQAATEMISTKPHITLEAIGLESGFKSKSAFYAAFKAIHNQTPAQFKRTDQSN